MNKVDTSLLVHILTEDFNAQKGFPLPSGHEIFWRINDAMIRPNNEGSLDPLVLLHYTPNAPPVIKQHIRGVIVDMYTRKVISWGYGDSTEEVRNTPIRGDESTRVRLLPGTQGIMLQVYMINNTLMVSSYKKLNVLDEKTYSTAETYRYYINKITSTDDAEAVFAPLFDVPEETKRDEEEYEWPNVHYLILSTKEFMTVGPLYIQGIWHIGSSVYLPHSYGRYITPKPELSYDDAQAFMNGTLGAPRDDIIAGGVVYTREDGFMRSAERVNNGFIVAEIEHLRTGEMEIKEIWPPKLMAQRELLSKGTVYRSYQEMEFDKFAETKVLPDNNGFHADGTNIWQWLYLWVNPIYSHDVTTYYSTLRHDLEQVREFAWNWPARFDFITQVIAPNNPNFIRFFMSQAVANSYTAFYRYLHSDQHISYSSAYRYLMNLHVSNFNKMHKLVLRVQDVA